MIASINVQNANAILCKVVNVLTHNVLSQGIYMNSCTVAKQIFAFPLSDIIKNFRPLRVYFVRNRWALAVELPLKAITRGYSYTVLPNSWTNRKTGKSKLKIKEMGSRYLFIVLYCLIEKWLSLGDYKKDKPHLKRPGPP